MSWGRTPSANSRGTRLLRRASPLSLSVGGQLDGEEHHTITADQSFKQGTTLMLITENNN